jgi:hypothetical protein
MEQPVEEQPMALDDVSQGMMGDMDGDLWDIGGKSGSTDAFDPLFFSGNLGGFL